MRLSIRKRLPLSYAGVALLAALILGGVLLLGLSDYYKRVEREYLSSNAQTMSVSLVGLLESKADDDELQAHLNSLAFLTQTKVTLFDVDREVRVSSAQPGSYRVALAPFLDLALDETAQRRMDDDGPRTIVVVPPVSTDGETESPFLRGITVSSWPRTRAPLAEGRLELLRSITDTMVLRTPATEVSDYSSEIHTSPVFSSSGGLLGYIQLSQGPAYAREVVRSAARAWAVAAAVATVLAAATGWYMSRSVYIPLANLHSATQRMAGGDLSARASLEGRDELGDLASVFNMMAERTEQMVTTLRRFAADAAHGIHTPLTALRTSIELARQRAQQTDDRHLVAAEDQAKRLQDVATKLLILSRIEGAIPAAHMEMVSLTNLIRTVGEEYASLLEQAGKRFVLSSTEAPVFVQGGEQQLRTALDNLLDNAAKFTPSEGLVTLALERRENLAVISVEDTGIGINDEDMPHLFQRFQRGRNASQFPGSGLGLAIVKAIAEEHGGRVRAEALPTGSRFVLELPTS